MAEGLYYASQVAQPQMDIKSVGWQRDMIHCLIAAGRNLDNLYYGNLYEY